MDNSIIKLNVLSKHLMSGNEYNSVDDIVSDLEAQIDELKDQVNDKDERIAELEQEVEELKPVYDEA